MVGGSGEKSIHSGSSPPPPPPSTHRVLTHVCSGCCCCCEEAGWRAVNTGTSDTEKLRWRRRGERKRKKRKAGLLFGSLVDCRRSPSTQKGWMLLDVKLYSFIYRDIVTMHALASRDFPDPAQAARIVNLFSHPLCSKLSCFFKQYYS
ncbi:unnamed protein product [Gadus morhua 'NCC']